MVIETDTVTITISGKDVAVIVQALKDIRDSFFAPSEYKDLAKKILAQMPEVYHG